VGFRGKGAFLSIVDCWGKVCYSKSMKSKCPFCGRVVRLKVLIGKPPAIEVSDYERAARARRLAEVRHLRWPKKVVGLPVAESS